MKQPLPLSHWTYGNTRLVPVMPKSERSRAHSPQAGWLPERKKSKDGMELLGILKFLPRSTKKGNAGAKRKPSMLKETSKRGLNVLL